MWSEKRSCDDLLHEYMRETGGEFSLTTDKTLPFTVEVKALLFLWTFSHSATADINLS